MTFRAGIIGCGNIGARYDERIDDGKVYTHAGMYRATEGIDLVSAIDADPVRLAEFDRYWGPVTCYQDYREMLEREQLDIVSIATPDETHHRIMLDTIRLQSPRLIFTEKPLAMNFEDALEVLECSAKRNVTIVVDYVRRWDENHQRAREMIQSGRLGAIQAVTSYYVRGIRHNGCQMINTLQFLLGRIAEVRVVETNGLGSFPSDPSLDLVLTLENGTPVHMISLDKKGYFFSIFEIDICGEGGRLRLLDGGQRFEYYEAETDLQFPNFRKLAIATCGFDMWTYGFAMKRAGAQLVSFLTGEIDCVENSVAEALDDLNVIEAALRSAEHHNRTVVVERHPKSSQIIGGSINGRSGNIWW